MLVAVTMPRSASMAQTRLKWKETQPDPEDRLGPSLVGSLPALAPSRPGASPAGLGTTTSRLPQGFQGILQGAAVGAVGTLGAAGAIGAVGIPLAAVGGAIGSLVGGVFPGRSRPVPPVVAAPVDPRAEVEQLATAFKTGPEQIVETSSYVGIGGVRLKRRTT